MTDSPTKDENDVVHAEYWSGVGATLCGDVLEGDSSAGIEPAVLARTGMRVTCPQCLCAIQHVYAFFTVNGKRR